MESNREIIRESETHSRNEDKKKINLLILHGNEVDKR